MQLNLTNQCQSGRSASEAGVSEPERVCGSGEYLVSVRFPSWLVFADDFCTSSLTAELLLISP